MAQIILRPVTHRQELYIGIEAPLSEKINTEIRKLPGRRYSSTLRTWLVPLTKENYKITFNTLSAIAETDGSAMITWFKEHAANDTPITASSAKVIPASLKTKPSTEILPVNDHVIKHMRQMLELKSYSKSTQRTYLNEIQQFLQIIKQEPADNFTTKRLKDYLQYCYATLKLTENTIHSRMNALKFYYEQVLNKEKLFWDIPRPKKRLILPKLLNETELRKLFNSLTNKKHKAMLFTVYSAGLRVSEVVNLKLSDIDSSRMQIMIQCAKGKKDRYVNLSPVLLDILRAYVKEYKPAPKAFVFESEQTGKPYPTRTVQQVFNNALKKAGIKKEVGIHSLRHSFATHLLDKGTDIKYIKDLLGHFNITTTERYLHVSKQQLVNIVSPFDDLFKTGEIDW